MKQFVSNLACKSKMLKLIFMTKVSSNFVGGVDSQIDREIERTIE